jgi:tRNA A-37 threonylcarbamoyl transferase component Bud32
MEKIIKELKGHSGSKILLMENERGLFVRKIDNIDRNLERLTALYRIGYAVPIVLNHTNNQLDMQYVHGLDIKTYLTHNNINDLSKFILATFKSFSSQYVKNKDYTETYKNKLEWIDSTTGLPFTKDELISKTPKILPSTMYHGDLTLENIMHSDAGFYMIDPVTSEYDSYVFDIAKMRQDLECKWFLRGTDIKLDIKLQQLQENIKEVYPEAFDNSFLILMLLRVLSHCQKGDDDYKFLLKNIKRLWESLK